MYCGWFLCPEVNPEMCCWYAGEGSNSLSGKPVEPGGFEWAEILSSSNSL
jgi:hypothetical protein